MQRANSSNISGVEYDAAQRVLTVQFHGGRVYRYADVPAETYHRFRLADSAGRFFGREIRGKFASERIR